MRLLSLTVLPAALIASASLGAGWESGMIEDEGGPVMQAWVQATDSGDVPPELRMMCGDQVNLRYGQGTSLGEGVEPIRDPVSFTFDFGDDMFSLDMQYEEMDGMYAAYFEPDSLILGYLRAGDSVAVDVPSGPWPVQEFTLQGSSKAIAAVLKSCD
jgi:hypothetical protein